MTSRRTSEELVPPDGGWGWLVLVGAMLVNILIPGTIKSFGVLFVEFMEVFDASPALAAWIPALCYFLYSSLGPISSILSVTLSYRTVTIIGGFFAASGMILCFWANSVLYLCISYGVFVGIGAGLSYPPTVYIVTSYFVRYRGLANGLCISGSSLGSIVLPHVLRLFIETYGYRGAILILGGITLHVWVGAIIFDPVEKHMKRVRVGGRCAETDGETHEMDLLLLDKTRQEDERDGGDEEREQETFLSKHVVVQMANNDDYDDENAILPIVSSSSSMTIAADAGGSARRLTDGGSRTTTAGTITAPMFSPSAIASPSRPSFQKSASSATVQNFKSPTLLSQTRNFQMTRRDRDRDRKISAPIQRNPYYADTELAGQEVSSTSALHAIPEKMYESERHFFSSNATDAGLGAVAMAAEAAEAAAAVVVAAATAAAVAGTSSSRNGIGGSNLATGHSSILTPRKSTSFTSSFQYISTPFHGSLLSIKPEPDEISVSSRRPRLDNNNEQQQQLMTAIDSADDCDKIMMRVDVERKQQQQQRQRQRHRSVAADETTGAGAGAGTATKTKNHFDISLLRDPLYLIILISNSTNAISYTNFVILLPAFGVSMQFDKSQAANLISIVSTFDLIGRIGGSALSDITHCPKHWYFVSGLLCSGISLTFMSLAGSYSALSVFCAIFGLFSGIYVGITAVIMADMLGTERLISSYGISLFVNGVLQLIGPPICGYWYESTNSYVPLFTTFGLILIFGSSIWGFVPFLKRNNIAASDTAEETTATATTTPTATADSSTNLQ